MKKTLQLFGLTISTFSKMELFSWLQKQLLGKNVPMQILCTPNAEQIVQAQEDVAFQKILQKADLLIPDGFFPFVFSSRLLKFFGKSEGIIPERISGVEVAEFLLREAKQQEQNMLLIGGYEYQRERPRSRLCEDFPKKDRQLYELEQHLFWLADFQYQENTNEDALLKQLLDYCQPKIVFVALGAPKQEQWLWQNRQLLQKSGVKIALVVGGAFDFHFGKVKRAPIAWQNLGLEWLYRLLQEPWRAKRQGRLLRFLVLLWQTLVSSVPKT